MRLLRGFCILLIIHHFIVVPWNKTELHVKQCCSYRGLEWGWVNDDRILGELILEYHKRQSCETLFAYLLCNKCLNKFLSWQCVLCANVCVFSNCLTNAVRRLDSWTAVWTVFLVPFVDGRLSVLISLCAQCHDSWLMKHSPAPRVRSSCPDDKSCFSFCHRFKSLWEMLCFHQLVVWYFYWNWLLFICVWVCVCVCVFELTLANQLMNI